MAYNLWLFGLLLLISSQTSNAQQVPVKFYSVIQNDSVMMFFNKRDHYVEKQCADYIRYCRLDDKGDLNGYFKDYDIKNNLRATGHYLHGIKQGYFELYFANGKIQSKGNYENNKQKGSWEYFHENGVPERSISIVGNDTLLVRLVNEKGDQIINDGNGNFEGLVCGNSGTENLIIAKGKIVNGKADGKWTSTSFNNIFCKEEFENGRFIQGIFPDAKAGGQKTYKHMSFLKNLLPVNYLNSVETIRLENCSDSLLYEPIKYDFNFRNFADDLNRELYGKINSGNSLPVGADSYLTIKFDINKDGGAQNFELLSHWGQHISRTIISSIKRNTKFIHGQKKMYFHLRVFPAGAWRFNFSESSIIPF